MNDGFERTQEQNEQTESAQSTQRAADDLNRYEYRYNYQEASRWQSDTQKYNSQTEPPKPEKKRAKWWIPVAAGMAVLVALITVGTIFGVRAISRYADSSGIKDQIKEEIRDEIQDFKDSQNLISEDTTEGAVIIDQTETAAAGNVSGILLTDVSDVVSQVMPSVVSITSRELVSSGYYWGIFNRGQSGQTQEVESGIGSGTIVGQNEEELLILTSYHVVEGSSSLYVTFCDDSAVDGYIKAASEGDDIAIVAVTLDDIPQSTLDSIKIARLSNDDIEIGDGVIIIGNALGYGQSVTTGIVSAKDRQITVEGNKTVTTIQTDAAINNGNSGGCMLNANGELIGISEAKISSSAVEGMCYAISIRTYYDTITEMLDRAPQASGSGNDGTENSSESVQGGFLGIQGYDINSQLAASYGLEEGIYVFNTVSGSGAEKAGLEQGDIIIGINGKTVRTMDALKAELAKYGEGDKVTLTVLKYSENGYEETEIDVVLTAAIG